MTFFYLSILSFLFYIFLFIYIQPDNEKTLFDPCVLIILIYFGVYIAPSIEVILFGKWNDNIYQVDIEILERLSTYSFIFINTFSLFYIFTDKLFKIKLKNDLKQYTDINPVIYFKYIIFCTIIIKILFTYYGVGSTGDYTSDVLARYSIPLFIAQSLNIMQNIVWVSIFFLIASTIQKKHKLLSIKYIWIVYVIYFIDMIIYKSRSNFVLLTIIIALGFNLNKKFIGIKKESIFLVTLAALMELFSQIRSDAYEGISIEGSTFTTPSEFLSVYNNALFIIGLENTNNSVSWTPTRTRAPKKMTTFAFSS